jgi:hypothetical protein
VNLPSKSSVAFRWVASIGLIVFAYARVGHACAVCIDLGSRSTGAFTLSTVFLSLMPLVMVGGVAFWIRRALRQRANHPEGGFSPDLPATSPSGESAWKAKPNR